MLWEQSCGSLLLSLTTCSGPKGGCELLGVSESCLSISLYIEQLHTMYELAALLADSSLLMWLTPHHKSAGVRLASGEELSADLVVDCSGHRAHAKHWLQVC